MKKARLASGTIIDGFQIGELVHTGGMARLWSVTHPDHDFPMLMKVPMMGEGDDPAAIVSFEMEQMIFPRISGPHVPRFVANGDFAIQPYIVLERLPGQSLYPIIDRLPLAAGEVVSVGLKVARALDSLHQQNVVHLDLKPSNIMFRQSGEAVLIDYGLARHLLLPDLMDEEFRLPYGTAPYMAPEQILGNRSDIRSDLFALGAMLYFLATGKRPFGDPQRLSGLKKRLWRDPWPPRALNPAVSPALQEIILRLLSVNPAWRHPTAAQLALDLQDIDHVRLTLRSGKLARDSWSTVIRRRFNPEKLDDVKPDMATRQLASAPVVAVAIDLAEGSDELLDLLRQTAGTIAAQNPDARIACLNILKINRIALDRTLDDEGNNRHVQRLVELKNWAAPINTDGSVTFHVIEAVSPATAILDYARANNVDHIVMGARSESAMRSLLGSVSGEVAAHAPCTVTVVRRRTATNAGELLAGS